MEVGGSQFNAIELAESVQLRGHQVVLYAPDGDLVAEAERRGLEVIRSPLVDRTLPRPTSVMRAISVAANGRFDLVHSYECDTTIDTMFGPGWMLGLPVLSTVLSMKVPFYLPANIPLVVGTRDLYESESRRRPEVYLMEPPIDVTRNSPNSAPLLSEGGEPTTVRARWHIPADAFLVVLVGRLAQELKIEGVLSAIESMPLIPPHFNAHLLIVGDGPERHRVDTVARRVNSARPTPLVTVAGQLLDPRAVYDAADLILGMGGSVLRGMAFAKPVVVQGERGFWQKLDARTKDTFLQQGWYGTGDGGDGSARLASIIEELARSPHERATNGNLGRRLVVEGYSLDAAASRLEEIYTRLKARKSPTARRIGDGITTSFTLAKLELAVALQKLNSNGARR